jgi:hypothetical protein
MATAPLLRRSSDEQDGHDRLVRLETEVDHVSGALGNIAERLETHIDQNSKGFEELRLSMTKLAMAAETQANTGHTQAESMKELSSAVVTLTKNENRVTMLEDFKGRTEIHLKICDADRANLRERLGTTSERIDRIYWIAPILLLIAQGVWALIVHFKLL